MNEMGAHARLVKEKPLAEPEQEAPVEGLAEDPPKRRKQRKTRGKPTWIDVHVGQRVRQRRTLLGYSQERLAEALNLTFQQVQKYERGANRVGAGRLYELAKALDVPVTYFFEELPEAPDGAPSGPAMQEAAQRQYDADPMAQRETLLLVREIGRAHV